MSFLKAALTTTFSASVLLGVSTTHAAIVTNNLIANLDARDYNNGGALPADGTNLNAAGDGWDDLSGAPDHSFNGMVSSPTYRSSGPALINGNQVVEYDAASDLHFENFAFSGDQPHNTFIVTRLGTNWTSLFLLESNDLNVVREGYSFAQSGATGVVMEGGWGDNLTFDLGAGVIGAPVIIELQYSGGGWNGTNMSVFVNGVEVAVSGGSSLPLSFAGGAGENSAIGSVLGRAVDIEIGQYLMYNAALSDFDRNQTGAALASEWGITTSYVVPEPASLALLAVGSLLIVGRRRR